MAKRKPRRAVEAFGSRGMIVARLYVRASNDVEAIIAMRSHPRFDRMKAYLDAGYPYQIRLI